MSKEQQNEQRNTPESNTPNPKLVIWFNGTAELANHPKQNLPALKTDNPNHRVVTIAGVATPENRRKSNTLRNDRGLEKIKRRISSLTGNLYGVNNDTWGGYKEESHVVQQLKALEAIHDFKEALIYKDVRADQKEHLTDEGVREGMDEHMKEHMGQIKSQWHEGQGNMHQHMKEHMHDYMDAHMDKHMKTVVKKASKMFKVPTDAKVKEFKEENPITYYEEYNKEYEKEYKKEYAKEHTKQFNKEYDREYRRAYIEKYMPDYTPRKIDLACVGYSRGAAVGLPAFLVSAAESSRNGEFKQSPKTGGTVQVDRGEAFKRHFARLSVTAIDPVPGLNPQDTFGLELMKDQDNPLREVFETLKENLEMPIDVTYMPGTHDMVKGLEGDQNWRKLAEDPPEGVEVKTLQVGRGHLAATFHREALVGQRYPKGNAPRDVLDRHVREFLGTVPEGAQSLSGIKEAVELRDREILTNLALGEIPPRSEVLATLSKGAFKKMGALIGKYGEVVDLQKELIAQLKDPSKPRLVNGRSLDVADLDVELDELHGTLVRKSTAILDQTHPITSENWLVMTSAMTSAMTVERAQRSISKYSGEEAKVEKTKVEEEKVPKTPKKRPSL